LEQQTGGEILGVIASSPTDIQPVLDVVAKCAALRRDGYFNISHRWNILRMAAKYGIMIAAQPTYHRGRQGGELLLIGKQFTSTTSRDETEYPQYENTVRTALARHCFAGRSIGLIFIRRTEVRPLEKQINLPERSPIRR
jgi:hypothetical protein